MVINVNTSQINSVIPVSRGTARRAPSFGENWYKAAEEKVLGPLFKIPFLSKQRVLSEKKGDFVTNTIGKWKTPMNRFIIGVFAFVTQPWIDLFNPNVDSETRKMSWLRTMAKIIIGTATGVAVRHICITKMLPKLTKVGEDLIQAKNKKLATFFMPSDKKAVEILTKSKSMLSDHQNVIGTFIAIAVMTLTDPPLTIFLTNLFNKQRKEMEKRKALKQAQNESVKPQTTEVEQIKESNEAKEVKNG